MQVNVINAQDPSVIDYLIYPEQHVNNSQYFYQQVNRMNETLTDVGRQFMDISKSIYNQINDSNTIRMAKAAIRVAKGMLHPNSIYEVHNIDDMQGAQPVMQRYIMAYPEIRTLYHNQQCDGYSNTYIDMHPKDIGENHYDYRRVMHGIPVEVEKDNESSTYFKFYPDEPLDNDRDLTSDEKFTVINAWDIAKIFLDKGKDPTSIFNNDI